MIFVVDFDGTLCTEAWPAIGKANEGLIFDLKELKKLGHKVILSTMREGGLLEDAIEWCRIRGLEFDAVNDNLKECQEEYKNNPRKIFGDYYIDAKNLAIEDVWRVVLAAHRRKHEEDNQA